MTFFRTTFLALGFLMLASAFSYGVKTVKIQTSAVCEMCKDRIEAGLNALDGVMEARLDLATKKVKVKFDDKQQSEASLRLALTKMGYGADEIAPDAEAFKSLPGCCKSAKACSSAEKGAKAEGGKGCH